MSRIGNAPIPVPDGVDVSINGTQVNVKGPKGELGREFEACVSIVQEDGVLRVVRENERDYVKAIHGLTRSLLANMVTGVSDGFQRTLELVGTGYRAQQQGANLVIAAGYSHPVNVTPMEGIDLEAEAQNRIHVRGVDKQVVGEQAARIRGIRPPNAYTGKGIRYANEQVRLKPGKRAGAA